MIPEYREAFNSRFRPEKYERFLRELDERCGAHVKFRCSETPCFFPEELLQRMSRAGLELVQQILRNREYLQSADAVIPPQFLVKAASDQPLFVQADFGIIASKEGRWQPRLVEIQGFPSLYAFQPVLAECYREVYELDPRLLSLLGGIDNAEYNAMLRRAILGEQDPENVVLLEVDPESQKTLPDFLVTERICGIRTVNIRAVRKRAKKLFYSAGGREIPIRRIYNRAIADELGRGNVELDFSFSDPLDVEWAGNPNWFFRISKFSLPFLQHETVPKTWFLDQVIHQLPLAPEQLVLKPLFSFAGMGVTVGPTLEQLKAIPEGQQKDYILQERVDFAATIATPPGWAKAEVRIMYIWDRELKPVNTIVRTGRGKMMGVDHNRDLDWVGASAGFYPA